MDLGALEKQTLDLLKMPLSEQEETILALLKKVNRLEHERDELKERIARLLWTMEEHD